jgi:hypothetical protein
MREILLNIVPNCRIYEVSVDNRKGPVDAVMQIAEREINDDDEIIVSYCDYGTVWNYKEFKREIKEYCEMNDATKLDALKWLKKTLYDQYYGNTNK